MKNSILFALITFVMVGMWIGFSVYHTHVSTTIEPDVTRKIEPISPQFDTKTLDQIKTRRSVPVSLSTGLQLLTEAPSGSRSAQKPIISQDDEAATESANQL